jgi:hypothetical protein
MLTNSPKQRSKTPETGTRQAVDNLCERCASIDIDTALSRKSPTFRGQLVKKLGRNPKWNIDSCSLCRWLVTAEIFAAGRSRELRSYSSNKLQMGWQSVDVNMLGLDPMGPFLVPHQKDAAVVRRLKSSFINFELLRSWLRLCNEMHTKSCVAKESPSVPFMKLIDCNTSNIVPATHHRYVTLSYRWGPSSGPTEYLESLPKELPSTIRDSITVTRKIGFRYLWIDRYCINQLIPDEVSAQVRKMDLIYQNSEVTIVALGEDPTYGLPGAGERLRVAQGYAQVGRHLLISSLMDPRYHIDGSTWTDRGWTYQEALLSRRRLVFTDEQVYYECYGMHCCEALDFPLRSMHTKSLQMFKKPFCDGNNIGQFPRGVGSSPWEVLSRIEEYSMKFLTNPSDILNGILGILRAYEHSIHGVRHLFGVPILPQPVGMKRQIDGKGESSLWNSPMGFALGLCWDLKDRNIWEPPWSRNPAPSCRRPGFPSWSWTGWFGTINWEHTDKGTIWIDAGFQVKLELCDGQVMEWPDFHASYNTLNDCTAISQYIIISAWTTRVQFLEYTQLDRHDANSIFCRARVELEDGGHLLWVFPATTKEKFSPNKEYLGIHLIDHEPNLHGKQILFRGPALLVVSKVEDRMERVGFGWVTHSNYKMYSADGVWEHADNEFMSAWSRNRPQIVKAWQEIRLG